MSLQDVHVTREMLSPLISWIWFLTAEKLLDGGCLPDFQPIKLQDNKFLLF